MKKYILIVILPVCVLLILGFKNLQKNSFVTKPPAVWANNFTSLVKDGKVLNCNKDVDINIVVFLNDTMASYDKFRVELHRFDAKVDQVAAFKELVPSSDDYKNKYAGKDSARLRVIFPETSKAGSEFEINTSEIKGLKAVSDIFCFFKSHYYNNFYFIIKGYENTGNKNRFGEIEYVISSLCDKSVVFKNWSDVLR